MDDLERLALLYKPKLIVAGASAYPRDYDYARFRNICDKVGAILFMDMAHTSGLIAAGELKSPFEFCDIVTTTTHKSLRGPRSAMIFYKKKFEKQINMAVFPGLQGGPHNCNIGALAAHFVEVASEEFKAYAK